MLSLVLLSASNTRHCWSIMPCCVAKCMDILVVLPPLAQRSLLQVLRDNPQGVVLLCEMQMVCVTSSQIYKWGTFVYNGGAAQEESIAESLRVFVSDSKESFDSEPVPKRNLLTMCIPTANGPMPTYRWARARELYLWECYDHHYRISFPQALQQSPWDI